MARTDLKRVLLRAAIVTPPLGWDPRSALRSVTRPPRPFRPIQLIRFRPARPTPLTPPAPPSLFLLSCAVDSLAAGAASALGRSERSSRDPAIYGLGRGRSLVRDAAGHSSISITSVYTHVAIDDDGRVGDLFELRHALNSGRDSGDAAGRAEVGGHREHRGVRLDHGRTRRAGAGGRS